MPSKQVTNNDNALYTTSNGAPVARPYAAEKIGVHGPLLLQDFHHIDLLAHFNRERIPERVVHAKGAGAHGYFELTHDITDLTSASLFKKIGNRARTTIRFSTVGGESGSADTARDPRGFAIKIRTDDGNLDWVFNNTPVFFLRDPAKFPHFIHTQKRDPQTHLKDADMTWDYFSQNPESIHQILILYSDRGTPDGYHNMHGYSGHTFKFVRDDGEWVYVQVHLRADGGFKTLDSATAGRLAGENPDYGIQKLFEAIENKQYPSWTVYVQTMTPEQAEQFRYNDFPLRPVGKIVLDENPQNYFAEIEQAAFSPSHIVPGIEPSADPVLQSRLFSYPDTHRHRLGVNYQQLPVNAPVVPVANFQRDGAGTFVSQGARPNYQSTISSLTYRSKPYADTEHKHELWAGHARAHLHEITELDFEQPRNLYTKVLSQSDREHLINNIAEALGAVKSTEIKARQLAIFAAVDQGLSDAIAKAIGVPTVQPLVVASADEAVPLKTNVGQTTVKVA
ncbi:catalase [Multifurca ochricompacta]|uniref:Catalase n=1 Tax=Multifurca ochricompacta TaxID=376703 RepID=A0AAD4QN31_9AGAM|nr:catalase [Multifurca ochricompacta]